MNSITMENFRCFRERQTVQLAPLTLLVGENSTGKTSFLALIRALADAGYGRLVPDFKQEPYDLGGFEDIAFNASGVPLTVEAFHSGFEVADEMLGTVLFEFTFRKRASAAFPVERSYRSKDAAIVQSDNGEEEHAVTAITNRGRWRLKLPDEFRDNVHPAPSSLWFMQTSLYGAVDGSNGIQYANFVPLDHGPRLNTEDAGKLGALLDALFIPERTRPFAGAPIRSKPRRVYDPTKIAHDPEGIFLPAYLADVAGRLDEWAELKHRLEIFGARSGLFDEIQIRRFGDESDPFQVQVRKNGIYGRGHWRNLIDVGFGVSQALPVVTELLPPNRFEMFLLQQPEVHLHPSAQAALGSIFCDLAGSKELQRQLVVETHSDHLVRRVRMDVRDGLTPLHPEDVMILYFERGDLDVTIHEVTLDEMGNLNAPESYGRFFMEETARNLWGASANGSH